jgi:hypothetical protein
MLKLLTVFILLIPGFGYSSEDSHFNELQYSLREILTSKLPVKIDKESLQNGIIKSARVTSSVERVHDIFKLTKKEPISVRSEADFVLYLAADSILNDDYKTFSDKFMFNGSRFTELLVGNEENLSDSLRYIGALASLAERVDRGAYMSDTLLSEIVRKVPRDKIERLLWAGKLENTFIINLATSLPLANDASKFLSISYLTNLISLSIESLFHYNNTNVSVLRPKLAFQLNKINEIGFLGKINTGWLEPFFRSPLTESELELVDFYTAVLLNLYRSPRQVDITSGRAYLDGLTLLLSGCPAEHIGCARSQHALVQQQLNDAIAFERESIAQRLLIDFKRTSRAAGYTEVVTEIHLLLNEMKIAAIGANFAAYFEKRNAIQATIDKEFGPLKYDNLASFAERIGFEIELYINDINFGNTDGLESEIRNRLDFIVELRRRSIEYTKNRWAHNKLSELLAKVLSVSGRDVEAAGIVSATKIERLRRGEAVDHTPLLSLIGLIKHRSGYTDIYAETRLALALEEFKKDVSYQFESKSIIVRRLLEEVEKASVTSSYSWPEFWNKNKFLIYAYVFENSGIVHNTAITSLLGNTAVDEFDNDFASLFFKMHVNDIQDVKEKLSVISGTSSRQYVMIRRNQLQAASLFFFSVGNISDALLTLDVIREQEDADFSAGVTRSKFTRTRLKYSSSESEVVRRLDRPRRELHALRYELHLGPTNLASQIAEFSQAMNSRRQAIVEALERFGSQKGQRKSLPNVHKFDTKHVTIRSSVTSDNLYFYISGKNKTSRVAIEIKQTDLRRIIYNLYRSILSKDESSILSGTRTLSSLLKPLSQELGNFGKESFFVVPDDVLGLLPPSLLTEIFPSDRFLGYLSPIRNAAGSSTTVARNIAIAGFGATGGGAGFPRLPSVKREIEMLMRLPNGGKEKRVIHLDRDFTKLSLFNNLRNKARTVHIASHFTISGSTSDTARLLLGDGDEVSLSTLVSEVGNLRGVDLLTLSACETGVMLGSIDQQSRSINGLASTFTMLGVQSVIASLWKIDDAATADFMTLFYFFLKSENLPPAVALSKVQRAFAGLLDNELRGVSGPLGRVADSAVISRIPSYKPPFYWAGFVLIEGKSTLSR